MLRLPSNMHLVSPDPFPVHFAVALLRCRLLPRVGLTPYVGLRNGLIFSWLGGSSVDELAIKRSSIRKIPKLSSRIAAQSISRERQIHVTCHKTIVWKQ